MKSNDYIVNLFCVVVVVPCMLCYAMLCCEPSVSFVWQNIRAGLGLLNSAFETSDEEFESDSKKKKPLPPRKFRRLNSELKVGARAKGRVGLYLSNILAAWFFVVVFCYMYVVKCNCCLFLYVAVNVLLVDSNNFIDSVVKCVAFQGT